MNHAEVTVTVLGEQVKVPAYRTDRKTNPWEVSHTYGGKYGIGKGKSPMEAAESWAEYVRIAGATKPPPPPPIPPAESPNTPAA